MAKSKDELVESGSGSEHIEGASGNEQEEAEQQQLPAAKIKRYHRHTARQIQEMESCVSLSTNPIKYFSD